MLGYYLAMTCLNQNRHDSFSTFTYSPVIMKHLVPCIHGHTITPMNNWFLYIVRHEMFKVSKHDFYGIFGLHIKS